MYLLLAVTAALAYTVGGIFMKLSDGLSRLEPSMLVYLFFGVGPSMQSLAMRKAQLGVAYLFVLGLEAVLAFLFGVLWFRESHSFLKLCGVALVVAGIVMLHAGDA